MHDVWNMLKQMHIQLSREQPRLPSSPTSPRSLQPFAQDSDNRPSSPPPHHRSPPTDLKKMYRLRRAPLPRLRTGAPPRTNHRPSAAALSSASRRSPQPRPFCSLPQPRLQFSPRPRHRVFCSSEGTPATSLASRGICATRNMATSTRRRIGELFLHPPPAIAASCEDGVGKGKGEGK